MAKYFKKNRKMKLPTVSVVVPTYNRSEKLMQLIESLEEQDYPIKNIEIVVVDDNSSDDTSNKIKSLIKKYKNIKYFRNEKNLGPAATRNLGTKKANGKIIFFTDSDCFVPKEWLKKVVEEYSDKEVGGVGGYLEPRDKNIVAFLEKMQNKFILKIPNKKVVGYEKCPAGYTNSMTYLKKVLEEVKGFDEDFKYPAGEDFELKKRVCNKGYKIVYIPEAIIHCDDYNRNYLFNRIITRALNKNPPKDKTLKVFYVIFMMPVILLKVLQKIIKYKKESLI